MRQGQLFRLHMAHTRPKSRNAAYLATSRFLPKTFYSPFAKLTAFPVASVKTATIREVSLPVTWQSTGSLLCIPFVWLDNSQRYLRLDMLRAWEIEDTTDMGQ